MSNFQYASLASYLPIRQGSAIKFKNKNLKLIAGAKNAKVR
ncbi:MULTISPECIES: hypothetical protein [unclassified Pseudoalteromonas]